jgi:type II secretory pathway component GspD/PulD (secretin)
MHTRISFVPITALLLAIANLAFAQSPVSQNDRYRVSFQNVEIVTLAEVVASATGKQIILHPGVHGLVTLIAGQPMSASQMYSAFAWTLATKGYVIDETSDVVQIYPGRVHD